MMGFIRFFARNILRHALLCLLAVLAACEAAPPPAEQTLIANNQLWGTQLAEIRGTATVAYDRLNQTAETAATGVAAVEVQRVALGATLVNAGADPTLVTQYEAGPGGVLIVPTAAAARDEQPLPVDPFAAPPPTPTVGPTATVGPVAVNGATLTNIVTSVGVWQDDCALEPQTSFTTAAPTIYVITNANNVQPGMNISSRWMDNGAEIAVYDFTPDFPINGNCIWFYIDASAITFTPGSWTVDLAIDGTVVGTAQFSIAPA
jgi:hypothetical protein